MAIPVVALAEAEGCDRLVCKEEHGDDSRRMQCVCNATFACRTHHKKLSGFRVIVRVRASGEER